MAFIAQTTAEGGLNSVLIKYKNFLINKYLYHKFRKIYALESSTNKENQVWWKTEVDRPVNVREYFQKVFR